MRKIEYQKFTPSEQKCISRQISSAIKEGFPRDQAVAKAISICAPKKVRMKNNLVSSGAFCNALKIACFSAGEPMKKYQEILKTSEDPRDGHVHEIPELDSEGNGMTATASGEESEAHSHEIKDFKVVPMEAADGSYTSRHPGTIAKPEVESLSLKEQEFTAEKNKDGTFNVRDLPIFANHKVPGSDKIITSKWLNKAVGKAHKRFEDDGFKAPLHIQHHGTGNKPEPAGFFMPTAVRKAEFEGDVRDVVFADLLEIPDAVFQKIKAGQLPYRSVEILDINKPSIDSLALLDTEVPFFRFKPLTVKSVKKAKKVAASEVPVLAYRASGQSRALLFDFGVPQMPEHINQDEEAKTEIEAAPEGAGMEERMDQMLALLSAIAEKIGVEMEEVEEEKEEVEEEEKPTPGPVEVEAKAANYSQLRAKVAALESFKRNQERKQEIDRMVISARTDLKAYHLDDDDLKELYDAAVSGGKAAVSVYVGTMKKYREPEPNGTLEEAFGSGPGEPEELQDYLQNPDQLARARVYSAQYDELKSKNEMSTEISRSQFIKDQFGSSE